MQVKTIYKASRRSPLHLNPVLTCEILLKGPGPTFASFLGDEAAMPQRRVSGESAVMSSPITADPEASTPVRTLAYSLHGLRTSFGSTETLLSLFSALETNVP